ncbi:hypothetical protein [Chitinophaga sp. Ak27]|uniref:hypothetical protein n=1 Tax=Chitinophaga sp. Ak27 TaxID=2726116 RepID=UPI00145D62C8|nr:hypothetical protein [Chitinophaga sp. Ak27]NLU92308.1 hypothetical protein [Chitinophaga sp. Ak27]
MDSSSITRKFERLLFKGVPEQPESTWERNGYDNVFMRQSGKSHTPSISTTEDNVDIVGYFIYNDENQTEIFQRCDLSK